MSLLSSICLPLLHKYNDERTGVTDVTKIFPNTQRSNEMKLFHRRQKLGRRTVDRTLLVPFCTGPNRETRTVKACGIKRVAIGTRFDWLHPIALRSISFFRFLTPHTTNQNSRIFLETRMSWSLIKSLRIHSICRASSLRSCLGSAPFHVPWHLCSSGRCNYMLGFSRVCKSVRFDFITPIFQSFSVTIKIAKQNSNLGVRALRKAEKGVSMQSPKLVRIWKHTQSRLTWTRPTRIHHCKHELVRSSHEWGVLSYRSSSQRW